MIRKFHITSKHYVHDSRIYQKFCLYENRSKINSTVVGFKKLRDVEHTILLKRSRYTFLNWLSILFFILSVKIKNKNVVFQLHDIDIYYMGIVAKLAGAKVIIDIHEDYFVQRRFNRLVQFFIKVYYLILRVWVDGFIFATEGVRYNSSLPGIVIRNLPEEVVIRKFDKISNTPKIRALYVGSLSMHRCSDFMAELCRFTPELQFDYYGDRPVRGNFFDETNYLYFCEAWKGYLHDEKAAVYIKYDIGLCLYDPATHFEVLPVKSYEYQALGLYVLGAGNFELSRQLENGYFGVYLGNRPSITDAQKAVKALHHSITSLREQRLQRLTKFGTDLTWISEFDRFLVWQKEILNG